MAKNMKSNNAVELIYYDPLRVGSFGGVRPLVRESGMGVQDVRNWLEAQKTYTLHRPPKRRFRRRKTLSTGIDDLWQADLVDLTSLSRHNDGMKFILVVIDVFSKWAFVRPLPNKSGATLRNAFSSIIDSRKPIYLQTDKGTEFLNGAFQALLAENNIKFYTSQNEDIKCAVVERFNRTLKSRMFRYFTYASSSRYIDVLQQLVTSYNNSYHSSIKTSPASVTVEDEPEIRKLLYPPKKLPLKWRFKVEDKVRLSQARRPFQKGYLPTWTTEIFTVKTRVPTDPPTYEIEDYEAKKYWENFMPMNCRK